MNRLDDENKIISDFQEVNNSEVMFVPQLKEIENIYRIIHTDTFGDKWINSSGKSEPPPDYYSPENKLMMDVMRVDDQAYIDSKGKIQNPTNVKESKLYKELKQYGLLDAFHNEDPIIIAKTELPSEKDHNYSFYKSNFKRVVSEHIRKLPLYQSNHIGYRTILFVMDESSAYVQYEGQKPDMDVVQEGEELKGTPHLFFFDKSFVETFMHTGIDYLVWFAPYKLIRTSDGIVELPKAVIFDCKINLIEKLIEYDDGKICSSEL